MWLHIIKKFHAKYTPCVKCSLKCSYIAWCEIESFHTQADLLPALSVICHSPEAVDRTAQVPQNP